MIALRNETITILANMLATNITKQTDSLVIKGGRPLHGDVTIRGAKNSVPKNLVAALLSSERSVLRNVARIKDVDVVTDMIRCLGGQVEEIDPSTLEVFAPNIALMDSEKWAAFAGQSRIPILFCGPLLARLGRAVIPSLGGCSIGPRPVDYHLTALQKFGAVIESDDENGIMLTAKKLRGCKIALEYPSVGATEQVLLTAVLAEGVTELSNAAVEPEIIDLIMLLQKMGAVISVDTDRVITVVGVSSLHGFSHTALPDRLEAASWACAAAATNGNIFVKGAQQADMTTFLNKFRQFGGAFEVREDGIAFWRSEARLKAVVLETDVHPGFMTDWQQPFVVALTQADGISIVHETVYEDRFGYVSALNDMGAQIQLHAECLGGKRCRFGHRNYLHSAIIAGPRVLTGADVTIPDLRAGFSYVIAALVAEGASTIRNIGLIRRGYEDFYCKLRALGADVGGSCELHA
jgi:UDP-N-acetylglucosamine 1-carboxyvinyltransferase